MSAEIPKTQKGRKEIARTIIDRCPIDAVMNATDAAIFSTLLGDPLGTSYSHIKNPSYPTDPRCVTRLPGPFGAGGVFSWNHRIRKQWYLERGKPYDVRRDRILKALRAAVAHDLRDFLSAAADEGCARCDATEDLTTDHVEPPFLSIATEFINTRPVEVVNLKDGAGDVISDIDVEAQWIAFHAEQAAYQVLCRSCNASKGAK